MKEFVRRLAPGSFSALRGLKDKAMLEYRVVRHLRIGRLAKLLFRRSPRWQDEFPLQALSQHRISIRARGTELLAELSTDPTISGGAHTVYLNPSQWRASVLAPLREFYPDDAGIKVMRNKGSAAESHYFVDKGMIHSKLHMLAVHGHPHLSMVANLLFLRGLGPRLYDLTEIHVDGGVHVAYVSRHLEGGLPSSAACERGIRRLRDLTTSGALRLVVPLGFEHPDFACPACNGNAQCDDANEFQYVDFQNFVLGDYEKFLGSIAAAAAEATHFGSKILLRGGRYLYQAVPGLKRAGQRDVVARMTTIAAMLAEQGIVLKDKVVLDVGCNVGMMMGQYLAAGAAWCHGWDLSHVVTHTDNLLLGIGCTRFSTTGGNLEKNRPLLQDVPEFLGTRLAGCVVSYLAIRGHVGWLDALANIPWSLLIYEGHQGEDEEKSRLLLAELTNVTGGSIVALSTVRDGDSDARIVALVRR